MTTPTEVLFQIGDLVELHSVKEDDDFMPVLFVEYPKLSDCPFIVPQSIIQVPNGTIALLLESCGTNPNGYGLVQVLVNERTYLTMSAQVKKIEHVNSIKDI